MENKVEKKRVAVFEDTGDGSEAKQLLGYLKAVEIDAELVDDTIYVNCEYNGELSSAIVMGSVYCERNSLYNIGECTSGLSPATLRDWIDEYDETGKIKDIERLQEMDRRTEEENARLKAEEEAFLKGQSNS